MVAQEDVMSSPKAICDLDLYKITADDLKDIQCDFSMKSFGFRALNSLVFWFDVWFPSGGKLSTSPDLEDTHWQNTVLSIKENRLKQDDEIKGTIHIKQDKVFFRHLSVELDYSVNDGTPIKRNYHMDENCIEEN